MTGADYCTRKPVPGQVIGAGCEDCGHAMVLHVGVDHCPVCELVHFNQQLYRIVEGGPHAALMRAGLAAGGRYGNVRR